MAVVYSLTNPKDLFKDPKFKYYGKYAENIRFMQECPLYSTKIKENFWKIYSYNDDC